VSGLLAVAVEVADRDGERVARLGEDARAVAEQDGDEGGPR